MFRHQAAKKIFSLIRINGFAFDLEVLYLTKKLNLKKEEVPVIWINNSFSKLSLIQHSLPMFFDILKIRNIHRYAQIKEDVIVKDNAKTKFKTIN
jgi:dolichyl-phosphate beta-glucosyltransferase